MLRLPQSPSSTCSQSGYCLDLDVVLLIVNCDMSVCCVLLCSAAAIVVVDNEVIAAVAE